MTRLTSSIYAQANGDPPTGEEARRRNRAIAKAAWHKLGLVVLDLDDITDDWTRQAVQNIANELYGKRGQ